MNPDASAAPPSNATDEGAETNRDLASKLPVAVDTPSSDAIKKEANATAGDTAAAAAPSDDPDESAGDPADAQAVDFDDLVSGRFDLDSGAPPPPQADKRVLLPQVEQPKLHKVLAQSGLGSRLDMEQLIQQGRVAVNNQTAHIGQRIQFGDQVRIDGKLIELRIAPPPARVLAYHKPVGEVVTTDDPQSRPTVFRRLPRLQHGKWQSVGRLDLNTEGLLLFTNSGELANRLMHPRFGLEREYAVRVLGHLNDEEKQRLLEGVPLEDGMAQFSAIKEEVLGEGANQWYRVTISEGRNREVRRMIESVGHAVSRLIRIRYGAMLLPRGLKRGMWMELGERDIRALGEAAGASEQAISGGPMHERMPRTPAPRRGRGDRGRGAGPRPNRANAAPPAAAPDRAYPGPRRPAGRGAGNAERADGPAGGADFERGPRAGGRAEPARSAPSNRMKTAPGYIGADAFERQRQFAQRGKPRQGPGPARDTGQGPARGGSTGRGAPAAPRGGFGAPAAGRGTDAGRSATGPRSAAGPRGAPGPRGPGVGRGRSGPGAPPARGVGPARGRGPGGGRSGGGRSA